MSSSLRRLVAGVLGCLFLHFSICSAAEIKLIRDGDFVDQIVLTGAIEPNDGEIFERTPFTSGRTLVIFFSQGGSLLAALKIGRLIRARGLNTYVVNEAVCASACALAWLGGVRRIMSSTAKVGFTPLTWKAWEIKAVTASGNALVGSYLNGLGYSDTAIYYLTSAAPTVCFGSILPSSKKSEYWSRHMTFPVGMRCNRVILSDPLQERKTT